VKGPQKPRRNSPKIGTPRRKKRVRNSPTSSARLLDLVKQSLDDDIADDIVVIDLAGKTAIADYMVIGSGRNPRHISAMADHLKTKIKGASLAAPPVEGQDRAEWVLIDGGDVIIHLFRPESRALYNLEKMWGGQWTEANSAEATNEDTDKAMIEDPNSSPSDTAGA
jgi:ribosome-associated protein